MIEISAGGGVGGLRYTTAWSIISWSTFKEGALKTLVRGVVITASALLIKFF